jgi:mannose-6-phosphate isomerase-like protein (cupin superfamily)
MYRILALLAVAAAVQQPAPPSAPGTYVKGDDLKATVEKSIAERGNGMGAAPVVSGDHYGINLVKRTVPAGAISHPRGTEVHYIVDGGGTAVTGGRIVRPAGGGQATIEGGVSRHVAKGDIVFIPAGTPHWYSQIDGSITYLETRFEVEGK